MALKLEWPFDSKIKSVASDGKFGRRGKYDYYYPNGVKTRLPHQGSDYREKCNTDWWWPLSGRIDLFEQRNYGYGYYSRIRATNGWYFGIAHNNKLSGYKGKIVKAGSYGGKTGNTGTGTACHAHIELRNPQGKVVNPETNIKWIPRKKVDIFKDKSGIFNRTLSAASWNASAVRYYKDFKNTLSKLNKLKATLKSDYVTKKVLAQTQDKYEKIFREQEILYKNLGGSLAEEHKLLTKLEAKFDDIQTDFDNLQTDRKQINQLLDISPEATQDTRLKAIQKIMAGKPPPAYQQKTPDKWINEVWKSFKKTEVYKWIDNHILH